MATELGKAYVQIIPSARGIKNQIAQSIGAEQIGQRAGLSLGSSLKKAFLAVGITTAIVGTFKAALSQGAELQQSIGGIETLFKESSSKMKAYANEAYKTSGLSANEYMKNVTSFSASLLQSLGGDTSKAADISNMAMQDMADNMNKMGTPLQDIQNAYQGFAKQNYTMLDNLKLGYGGTKQEMERLLADAEKLTGVKYDINNLSDVYEAIHAVQTELGITGTTAKEAQTTLSGSFGMMKAAWQDLLGKAAIGENLSQPIKNLVSSIVAFLQNAIPMIIQIAASLPVALVETLAQLAPTLLPMIVTQVTNLITGVGQALPTFLEVCLQLITELANGLIGAIPILCAAIPPIIQGITNFLVGAIPQIIQTGVTLLTSLVSALPQIISTIVAAIPTIITGIVNAVTTLIPQIVEAGINLLVSLIQALPQIITTILPAIPQIIISIVGAIIKNIPTIIKAGFDLLIALIKALPKILVALVKAGAKIISSIVGAIGKGLGHMISAGKNLMMGLVKGIGGAIAGVVKAVGRVCGKILGKVKSFFGINSPSKVFEKIGVYLNAGLAQGINNSLKPVSKAIQGVRDIVTEDFEASLGFKANSGGLAIDSLSTGLNSGIDFDEFKTADRDINQTVNIYQPVPTPAETARELRKQAIRLGFAGV